MSAHAYKKAAAGQQNGVSDRSNGGSLNALQEFGQVGLNRRYSAFCRAVVTYREVLPRWKARRT
ncbi:protein of unknown function [Pararobbsia alpina]